MNRFILLLVSSILIATTPAALGAGSGGGGGSLSAPSTSRGYSPEQLSERALRAGIRHRDKALKHEARAAKAKNDKSKQRSLAKAEKEFQKAIEKQGEAIRLDSQNYKAANELGYALRKTGDYRKAIGAYNFALKINPNFHQATEYRAEAFLALGLLDLTRDSYMILFRNDRELADELMTKFDAWGAAREAEFSEQEQTFWSWVQERKRIAQMANELSLHSPAAPSSHHWPSI